MDQDLRPRDAMNPNPIEEQFSLAQADEVLTHLCYLHRKLRLVLTFGYFSDEPVLPVVLEELEELDEAVVSMKAAINRAIRRPPRGK